FDRDVKYGWEVPAAVRSLKMTPVRTSLESPWQNGIAERWVGSCCRDLLDRVIAFNEGHLKRLLREYISYHHEDRTHLGLGKETPGGRSPAYLRVPSGHSRDWAGCTIVTIEPPNFNVAAKARSSHSLLYGLLHKPRASRRIAGSLGAWHSHPREGK